MIETLAAVCLRCRSAVDRGETDHPCIDRGDGGPHRLARDWRCDCPCDKATGTVPE